MEKKLNKALDSIDIKILNELQRNGKISNIDLSKKVGLSPTPCLERVKRLEKQGVIMGYRALLNPELLDAPLLVIVEITLIRGKPDVFEEFNAAIQALMNSLNVIWYQAIRLFTQNACSRYGRISKIIGYHLITFTRCE